MKYSQIKVAHLNYMANIKFICKSSKYYFPSTQNNLLTNMIRLLLSLTLFVVGTTTFAEIVVYSENFNGNSSNCTPNSFVRSWTVTDIGTQGSHSNQWYIYY